MKPNRAQKVLINTRAKIIDKVKATNPRLAQEISDIRLTWYTIKNQASDDGESTDVYIYDEIGGWCGIPADEFVQELNAITTPRINVRINSPGGSLFDAIAIYNALVSHNAYVTTYVDALAASAASIIAMAGDECIMMVGSQLMIHDAAGMEMGNAGDMRAMADFLDKQSDNIATVYSSKAGGEPDSWRAMMLAETWMFAAEAVECGLADSIYVKPKMPMEPTEPDQDDGGTAPDQGEPDQDDSVEVDAEEDTSDGIDKELQALMLKPHKVANRGFKYPGRRNAPTPAMISDDDALDNMIEALSTALGKVN
jgi:ATP-dependent protease ClpP protease subunit